MRGLWPTIISSKGKMVNNSGRPYLHEFFNIRPTFHTSISVRSVMARMLNEIINALNEEVILPKYIIILPDKDLIEEANFGGFGCKVIFESMLHWIATNVERVLEIRKDDLKSKRAGAILTDDEPSIVWVKMLTRPFIRITDKGFVFAQRHTFNKLMDSILPKYRNTSVIGFQINDEHNMFDLTGHLVGDGILLEGVESSNSMHGASTSDNQQYQLH